MLLHYLKFLAHLDSPVSQVTDRELETLVKYAQGAATAVEIGCYEGKTTTALAPYCKTLHTIDPFFPGRLGVSYGELIARRNVKRSGLKNVKFIKGMSWDVVRNFDKAIDFLFIDADHTYEAVKRDWADWFPKVMPAGIIALHDSHIAPNSPIELGSHQFFEQEIKSNPQVQVIDGVGALAIVRKLPLRTDGKLTVGIVGQVTPQKGHDDVLEILRLVPNVECLIFGGGDSRYIASLIERSLDYGVSERIHWRGYVDEKNEIYPCFDVLLVPSKYDEPFGMVVAEAMMFEKVVIAYRRGGIPEQIEDGVTGYLVDTFEQAAEKLNSLL